MPLGTNVGSVFFDIKANQSAFKKEIKGAAGQAQSVFSSAMGKVGKAIGVAFSAGGPPSFLSAKSVLRWRARRSPHGWV